MVTRAEESATRPAAMPKRIGPSETGGLPHGVEEPVSGHDRAIGMSGYPGSGGAIHRTHRLLHRRTPMAAQAAVGVLRCPDEGRTLRLGSKGVRE